MFLVLALEVVADEVHISSFIFLCYAAVVASYLHFTSDFVCSSRRLKLAQKDKLQSEEKKKSIPWKLKQNTAFLCPHIP